MTIESSGDAPIRTVSQVELFLGFLKIGLLGFGGIAPWARPLWAIAAGAAVNIAALQFT